MTVPTDEINARTGAIIRRYRQAKGQSVRQFAAQIGTSHVSLSRVETGKQSLSSAQLLVIAKLLDIPLSEFSISDTSEERQQADQIMREMTDILRTMVRDFHLMEKEFQDKVLELFAIEWAHPDIARLRPAIEEVAIELDGGGLTKKMINLANQLER